MKSSLMSVTCISAIIAGIAMWGHVAARGNADDADQAVIYELRTYTTAEGRLPDLHKRFRDHTMGLFEKHGMKNVIYWTPTDQENTLVYVIAHQSREAADRSWAAFREDPVWKKAYAASRENGPIVVRVEKQYLTATDYSPMK